MKKVLMITNRFIYGGIEKLLLDIFDNSINRHIQYDVLALTSEADQELVKHLNQVNVGYYTLGLDKLNRLVRKAHHYIRLYRFIKKNQYDVVHVNITSYRRSIDLLIAKAAGVQTRIIHAHSAGIHNSFTKEIYKPLRKLYDYSATHYCACSEEAARYLFSRNITVHGKYTVINNGIRTEEFRYSEKNRDRIRKEWKIKEDEILIGHVGRLTEAKNHKFLVDVFSKVVSKNQLYRLVLAGDGELKDAIEQQISDLGIEDKIIMLGSVSNIAEILSAFDLFVFPSVWEGLGISLIEAQCNGLPCFVSDKVPSKAIVTSNVTVLSLETGAEKWAKEILQTKRNRINETSAIKEAGYDINHTIKQLEKIYLGYNK